MAGQYEDRMLRVLEHIHANPAGDLSLDALADVAAMSRFHWHRVFHAMAGETCAQAVRRIRLYRAAEWLTGTDLPVAEIARRVGYPSVQSLGRAFRAGFGLPPARFRDIGAPYAPQLLKREIPLQTYDVVIETVPDRHLAAPAHRGPYPTLGATFEKLSAIATARGLWPQVADRVGVFLDDPAVVSARDLRSFAGLHCATGRRFPTIWSRSRSPASRWRDCIIADPIPGCTPPTAMSSVSGCRNPGASRPISRCMRSMSKPRLRPRLRIW